MAATSRLARMVQILQQDPGVSLDELAAHLGVPDAVVIMDLVRTGCAPGHAPRTHGAQSMTGWGASKA